MRRGHFSYAIVSLICVIATVVSAASTTIANHSVAEHPTIRRMDVPGRLADTAAPPVAGLDDRVALRVKALDHAQAPLNQLFDFIPDEGTDWMFVPEEWNNTWVGECAFRKYSAVDLEVLSTTSYWYQDLVPSLATYIPAWATVDPTKQGATPISSLQGKEMNATGAIRDSLITYVFGSAPYFGNTSLLTTNVSFVNILLHEIGLGVDGSFMNTSFKSDIHVAECTLNNSHPNPDQARADEGHYDYAASALVQVSYVQ